MNGCGQQSAWAVGIPQLTHRSSGSRGCGSLSFIIISRRVWRLSGKNSGFGQWIYNGVRFRNPSKYLQQKKTPIIFPLSAFIKKRKNFSLYIWDLGGIDWWKTFPLLVESGNGLVELVELLG
jgi:hypothetical protein